MKRILLTCIYLLLGLAGFAQNVNGQFNFLQEVRMQLVDTQEKILTGQHKSLTCVPHVVHDGQCLYIAPYYDVPEALVIIRDKADNIIYCMYPTDKFRHSNHASRKCYGRHVLY